MSKFNQGNLFALDVYDTDCYGCAIGPNKAKFRFQLGEINHLRNENMTCLNGKTNNYVIVDLHLYGVKIRKMRFLSTVQMQYTEVTDFSEKDGDLIIELLEDTGARIAFQIGYESYKWEFVKEYTPHDLSIEEEDRLAKDIIASKEELMDILWND